MYNKRTHHLHIGDIFLIKWNFLSKVEKKKTDELATTTYQMKCEFLNFVFIFLRGSQKKKRSHRMNCRGSPNNVISNSHIFTRIISFYVSQVKQKQNKRSINALTHKCFCYFTRHRAINNLTEHTQIDIKADLLRDSFDTVQHVMNSVAFHIN